MLFTMPGWGGKELFPWKGLRLPVVYDTSGHERVDILKILDGVVDIYLPDMKYMDPDKAAT